MSAAPALALAATGSWLLSRRLRRQTHGLGPAQMTRMYEYYDAVLHSVREGLVVLTTDRRVALVNDEGRRLLGLDADAPVIDQPVAGIDLPPAAAELLGSGRDARDEPILAGDRVLVANQRTTRFEGAVLGTVLTLRDQTELRTLASELDSVRALTEALQAQTHESANRLHTVLTLVELGRADEAVRLATRDLALAQQLTDRVVGAVTEPALAALLLGKSAQAGERGVDLVIEPDCRLDDSPLPTGDLLTVVGNLVDNALEAVAGTPAPRRVRVFVGAADDELVVRVADSGPGLAPERVADAFRRGWSTKSTGRGLGLALVGQVVRRHGGSAEVARSDDGGSLFTVRLPVQDRAVVTAIRVLVVEDEPLLAEAHSRVHRTGSRFRGGRRGAHRAGGDGGPARQRRRRRRPRTPGFSAARPARPGRLPGAARGRQQRRRARGDLRAGPGGGAHRGVPRGDPLPAQAVHVRRVPRQAGAVRATTARRRSPTARWPPSTRWTGCSPPCAAPPDTACPRGSTRRPSIGYAPRSPTAPAPRRGCPRPR